MIIFTFDAGEDMNYQNWIKQFFNMAETSTIENLDTSRLNEETINELIKYYEEKEDYEKCAKLVKQRDELKVKEERRKKSKYQIKID